MRLANLEIESVWSFKEKQQVDFDSKLTVLVGPNNAGKSNVLRAVRWLGNWSVKNLGDFAADELQACGYRADGETATPRFRFCVSEAISPPLAQLFSKVHGLAAPCPQTQRNMAKGWSIEVRNAKQGVLSGKVTWACDARECTQLCSYDDNLAIEARSTWANGAKLVQRWIGEELARSIVSIGPWRTLAEKQQTTGRTIRDDILDWQVPGINQVKDRKRFREMLEIFQRLSCLECRIEAPRAGAITISWNKLHVETDECGDGLKHLLVFAHALSDPVDRIFLLEEPETHLHPATQRAIVREMQSCPRHQFIITSHSPVFLNQSNAIVRVRHDGEQSNVSALVDADNAYEVLDDLGIQPSDLLQANTVIWVEGPSDRTFYRQCLKIVDPALIEGRDFEFVLFGGSLHAHLSAEWDRVDDLIRILSVSRRSLFIIDSDRKSSEAAISESKRRLEASANEYVMVWVTQGREVENYLHPEVVRQALIEMGHVGEVEEWDDPFTPFEQYWNECTRALDVPKWKKQYQDHKAALMKLLAAHMTSNSINRLDLQDRIQRAARHIRRMSVR